MTIKITWFLLFLIQLNSYIFGSELSVKPLAYLDVTTGKMIYNKIIKIKDDKIISIISDKNTNPKDYIELKDIYLLPGFTDCHSHIFLTETLEDNGLETALAREARLGSKERTDRAKRFLQQYLKEGFTSVCDLGNSGYFLDSNLKNEINSNQEYPLLLLSGPGIVIKKGQFYKNESNELVKKEYSIIDDNTNVDHLLQSYVDRSVDILKIYLDNSPGEGEMDEKLLIKLLSNSKVKFFKKITYHANLKSSFELALKLNLENLEHANVYLKNNHSGIKFVTTTDQDRETLKEFNLYKKYFYNNQINRIKTIYESQKKIVFGSDFYFHKDNTSFNRAKYAKRAINTFIEAKLPNFEIIKSLTINPALSMNEEKKFGQIRVNSLANIIGFKGNPLKKIEILMDTPLVINRGKIISY